MLSHPAYIINTIIIQQNSNNKPKPQKPKPSNVKLSHIAHIPKWLSHGTYILRNNPGANPNHNGVIRGYSKYRFG